MSRPQQSRLDPWLVDLYRAEYRSLVRLAGLLLDDRGLAEEVVQDAFVSCARSKGSDDPDKAAAYVRSAVMNGARSQLRKTKVRQKHLRSAAPPGTAPPADASVYAAADAQVVMDALRTLSPRQQEVLVLRYWSDFREAEIANILGISQGSVKTHTHRAMQALEALLDGTR